LYIDVRFFPVKIIGEQTTPLDAKAVARHAAAGEELIKSVAQDNTIPDCAFLINDPGCNNYPLSNKDTGYWLD